MIKHGVGILIYNKNKGILLIKRGSNVEFQPNKRENCGGSLEENETFLEAAKREVAEEIGRNSLKHLKIMKNPILHWTEKPINDNVHWETMLFYAEADDFLTPNVPKEESEYVCDPAWFKINEIPWHELTTYTKEDFERLMQKKIFPFDK